MTKTILRNWKIKIIYKKEFAKVELNKNIYINFFNLKSTQLKNLYYFIAHQKIIISSKYLNIINVFLKKSAIKYFKYLNINKFIINSEKISKFLIGQFIVLKL